MAPIYLRGGIPRILADGATVPTTLQKWEFPQVSNRIMVSVATNDVRLYFTEEDADADANYHTVASGTSIDWPAELGAIWTRAQSGSAAMDLIIFMVRG
jgi:hypothetical protein